MATQQKLCGCMDACWAISAPGLHPIPWPPLSTFWGAQLSMCSLPSLILSPTRSTGCMGNMAGPCLLLAGWRYVLRVTASTHINVSLQIVASAGITVQTGLGLQEARCHMEIAVNKGQAAGFETPDWEVAQHSWRLGRVLWELGPARYAGAKQAWTRAVAVEGPCQVYTQLECAHSLITFLIFFLFLSCTAQALAYAWLGLFYKQQVKGAAPARKCFQRALAIDPHLSIAGGGSLCAVLAHVCSYSLRQCWRP